MNSGKGMRKKLEVIWSFEAAKRSDQVIKYLLEEWSEKEAINFLETLKGFEELVSNFPELYPLSQKKKGYRKAVILKQISILYSVKRNSILVHTLFDNRQDPKRSEK